MNQRPPSLSKFRSKILIFMFHLQSSEWQWRLNAEWTVDALWTIGERLVSERWTLCERWTRENGERWTQNCERWTHDERTLNARWTDGEWTVNQRNKWKSRTFQGLYIFTGYLCNITILCLHHTPTRDRTRCLFIASQTPYRLSYAGL